LVKDSSISVHFFFNFSNSSFKAVVAMESSSSSVSLEKSATVVILFVTTGSHFLAVAIGFGGIGAPTGGRNQSRVTSGRLVECGLGFPAYPRDPLARREMLAMLA